MPDMGGIDAVREIRKDDPDAQGADVQRDGPAGARGRGDPGGRQGFRRQAVPALARARGGAARSRLSPMDLAKYAALFVSESREHLQSCNQLLLAWERDPEATAPVDGLFRAVHSLKGMAATMGFAPLAELAHRAENLLDAIRGGSWR